MFIVDLATAFKLVIKKAVQSPNRIPVFLIWHLAVVPNLPKMSAPFASTDRPRIFDLLIMLSDKKVF